MCQICTLALRHQRLSKSDSLLFNSKNLSAVVALTQQAEKLGKLAATKNQLLQHSD